jgi:hypothetical protein
VKELQEICEMKVCFVADCHYPNYTKRLQENLIKTFLDFELDKKGVHFFISTNRPNDFSGITNSSIHIYDIQEIRKKYPVSLEYEILPEDPTGIYPSKFPWNLERFLLKESASKGFNYIINFDSDVVTNAKSSEELMEYFSNNFFPNTVMTNQSIMHYKKGSQNEIFHLHDKYISHFGIEVVEDVFTTWDGPVIAYIGETSEDILNYFNVWNDLVEFGYKKEHGFGYGNIVCGNWSLSIPLSNFKLKWNSMPFYPDHKFSDRY